MPTAAAGAAATAAGVAGVTVAAASLSGLPTMHKLFDLPLDGVIHLGCPHAYQFAFEGESEADFVARLAKELGVNVYLGKPYQEEELLGYIAGFVKGSLH